MLAETYHFCLDENQEARFSHLFLGLMSLSSAINYMGVLNESCSGLLSICRRICKS